MPDFKDVHVADATILAQMENQTIALLRTTLGESHPYPEYSTPIMVRSRFRIARLTTLGTNRAQRSEVPASDISTRSSLSTTLLIGGSMLLMAAFILGCRHIEKRWRNRAGICSDQHH